MKQMNLKRELLAFILTPLVFSLISVAVLFLALKPVAAPYMGLASYVLSDAGQPQASDLYADLAENIANSQNQEEAQPETIGLSQMVYPAVGDRYGQITIEGTEVDAPVYYGDNTKVLNQGVGTYADSGSAGIPGEGKTILMAGHNNTFFNALQDVTGGEIVTIQTHYGVYTYEVIETKVLNYQDPTAYDFTRRDENLILYTCYPFDTLKFTPNRYFVYAKYVSGPMIDYAS